MKKIFSLILAFICLVCVTPAVANASYVQNSNNVSVDWKKLKETQISVSGFKMERSAGSNNKVGTQCIRNRPSNVWYGLKAGQCKAAGGDKFLLYDTVERKKIGEVNLQNVKPIHDGAISFGCAVTVGGFVLSIPGNPANVAGWILKGATLFLGAVGIVTSC